jgi:hypothetical protein
MKNRYEKYYYDLLQTLRDKEAENAQKARKAEKAKLKRPSDLNRLTSPTVHPNRGLR